MKDTVKWGIRKRIPFQASSDYRKYALEAARYELGHKLFDILWQNRLPCVVDINENIFQAPSENKPFPEPDDIIEYVVSITPVKYRDVTIPREFFNYLPLKPQENIIKRFFRKLFRK